MADRGSNRVEITNNLPAPQGFYAVDDAHRPAGDVDPVGMEPQYVKPGQTRILIIDDEQLRLARFLAPGVQIKELAASEGTATGPAVAPDGDANTPHGASDDGIRAKGPDALKPPHDNTGAVITGGGVETDQFDALDDDQLRAYITDAHPDGKPHHLTGRPKLLNLAREAASGPRQGGEAV